MNIVLLSIGKTKERYLLEGIDVYLNRLKYYNNIKLIELPNIKNIKNLSKKDLLLREGDMILKNINQLDHIVLLDSKGRHYNSLNFSSKLYFIIFLVSYCFVNCKSNFFCYLKNLLCSSLL